jgi:hypothetical protein
MSFLSSWRFDTISFWTGFLFAVLLAFVLFRLRHRIARLREAMAESYRTALEALTTTAGQGYRNDLMRWAQSSHIVSQLFALEEILLPPRLLVDPAPVDPNQPPEYDAPALFPFTPDWPQLAEAYGAKDIPLGQLLSLNTHTLLAGLPGSGKTTILAALALEWLRRSAETGAPAAGLPRALFYANANDPRRRFRPILKEACAARARSCCWTHWMKFPSPPRTKSARGWPRSSRNTPRRA